MIFLILMSNVVGNFTMMVTIYSHQFRLETFLIENFLIKNFKFCYDGNIYSRQFMVKTFLIEIFIIKIT